MNDFAYNLQLAIDARAKGQPTDAIEILESLVGITGGEQSADVWGNLIAAYIEAGSFKQAEQTALKRLRLIEHRSTEGAIVRFQLASARQRQGEFQSAVKEYTEIMKLEPFLSKCDDSGFLDSVKLQLAVCLAHLSNNPEVLKLLEQINIKSLGPQQRAEAAYYIGQSYYEAHNYEAALDAYRQAMQGPPGTFQVRGRYSAALALWQLHRDAEALEVLQPLTNLRQSDVPQEFLYSALSRIYTELGKPEEATHFAELAKLPRV